MTSAMKLITKKTLLSIGVISLIAPLSVIAQSNIVDYTKAPKSFNSSIMELTPNNKATSDEELKAFFNPNNIGSNSNSALLKEKKATSFCAETEARTGKVVGTIYRQKSGETILLVNSGKQLVKVEQDLKTKNAKIGSTVSIPAKNCD